MESGKSTSIRERENKITRYTWPNIPTQKQLINKNSNSKKKKEIGRLQTKNAIQEKKTKQRKRKKVSHMRENHYLLCRHMTIFGNVERTTLFPFPMKENCEEKLGLDMPFACFFFLFPQE